MYKTLLNTFITVLIFASAFSPIYCQNTIKEKWDSAWYFYKEKKPNQSLKYLDSLIILSPSVNDGYLMKAQILAELKEYRKSNAVLTLLLNVNPRVTEAYNRRGVNFIRLEQYDSGIMDFTQAIGKYPHHDSVAYRGRAFAYFRNGEYENSKRDYDSADKYYPADMYYLYDRALTKQALKDYAGAVNDLTQALKINPRYYEALKTRAIVHATSNNIDQCLADCNAFLRYKNNDLTMLFFRGQCYLTKKLFNEAIQDFNTCVQKKAQMPELFLLRGMANFYLAHDQQAINDLTKALETDPANSVIYLMLGTCKNNVKPGTGCEDLRMSLELGNPDVGAILKEECE